MNAPGNAAQHFVLEIVDALMVVAPRGWQSIDLRLERNANDALRVAELTTHLAGDRPLPKPSLGLEPGAFHGVINEALRDLADTLAYSGAAARVRRADDGFVLALLDPGGVVRHEIAIEGALADALIFTDRLFESLLAAEPELAARQNALGDKLRGHDDWNYDASTGTLTLNKGVLPWASLRAEPIGSFAYESESWLWAWANDTFSDARRATVAAVRDRARNERGMSVLVRPSLPSTEMFATRLAGLASLRMGARGIYGAPYGPGVLFLALLGDLPAH